jgi:arylsulfatase A-like enzyme
MFLVLGLTAWFGPAHSSRAAEARSKPNVILVMSDDQGYGDIHGHGNSMIRTPNLDRLRGQSVRLTNFHVDPTCSPTRSALMTGRYSTRTGVWHTIMGRSLMYRDEVTMADVFRQAGYHTGIFGKWHLGDNYPLRPQDRGFDEAVVNGGGGVTQTPDYWGNSYFDDTYFHNGKPQKYHGYCTDVFFGEALKFIEKSKDAHRPFFVYLPANVAHAPYHVADSYRRYYEERGVPPAMARFYGMIEELDENMGRLLARLRQWGLEDNTILIFMTDNGTAEGIEENRQPPGQKSKSSAWPGFNAGLRGVKGSQYDGGHRVPFFIRWPAGGLKAGADRPQLTAHIDVLPTLIELCGLQPPPGRHLDGISLVPLLRGQTENWPERTLFVHSQRIEHPEKWRQSAVMTDRWRLINGRELNDINLDPGQKQNVADQHPDVVSRLRAAYEDWWTSLEPRFDDYAWIVQGSDHENPARLTCHDWHAPSRQVPWNQQAVKSMPQANGYWMVEIERDGEYAFTLRHQPTDARFPLRATKARLKIGDVEASAPVPPDVTAVTLTATLKAGRYRLQTWLEDDRSGESRGAFFVQVMRME